MRKTRKITYFQRFLAALLALSLGFAPAAPAHALRSEQKGEQRATGLEELRQSLAGLEEDLEISVRGLLRFVGITQVSFSPEVLEDPALWKQVSRHLLHRLRDDDKAFQRVAEGKQSMLLGWGLELHPRAPGKAEIVAPEAGSAQSYEVYAGFAGFLRQQAREKRAVKLQLNETGLYYQTSQNPRWSLLEGVFLPTGLWEFLKDRGVTLDLAVSSEDNTGWEGLAWLLDPRTLRKNIPVRGKQEIWIPISLQGPQGRGLDSLHGAIAEQKRNPDTGDLLLTRFTVYSRANLTGRVAHVEMQVMARGEEFKARAVTPEERLDLERAVVRMGRLAEIADGLYRYHPDLAERYITDLAEPLLAIEDVRLLNRLLGSTTGFPFRLLHYHVESFSPRLEVDVALEVALQEKANWEEAKGSYYLPGLPIMVETQGLSEEGREKLEEMARQMTASGWFKPGAVPESLVYIESIVPRGVDEGYDADVGWFGHPRMKLVNEPHRLGASLNHEGEHYHIWQYPRRERIRAFEQKQNVPKVSYPWDREHQVPPSKILEELQTYAVTSQYLLHLWDTLEHDPVETGLLARPLYDLPRAREAITVLKEMPASLNEEAKAWLTELEKLWQDLAAQIHNRQRAWVWGRWTKVIGALLGVPEPEWLAPELFLELYGGPMSQLSETQRQETENWLAQEGIKILDIPISTPPALYTQSDRIREAVERDLLPKVPPGTFRLKPVPAPGSVWELGLLLGDREGAFIDHVPPRFPLKRLLPEEVSRLDPLADLLAPIYHWPQRIPTPLGARLMTNPDRRLHLLVFISA